ncbi:hypothetical protein AVEN_31436-1 [Araneus ventricosus]|uniref:Uncharacterized protein n=1 Tax=Araneus ventricosus TaxID=182803 RepID=A0A4Y2PFJ8_ARAVE|nr:hypothetical protein AVEN_31436-1 [Araneus ventricosus]
MLRHPLCTDFSITKLFVDYVMQSFFAYRQFNSNFTCGDQTILPYELIHSRNRGTVDHSVCMLRAWSDYRRPSPMNVRDEEFVRQTKLNPQKG